MRRSSGTWPTTSGRALCLEGRPSLTAIVFPGNTYDRQTDYYLSVGNETQGNMPADAWVQFWIYVNSSGTQLSTFPNRNKFWYPQQAAPTATAGEYGYLLLPGADGLEFGNPLNPSVATPANEMFLALEGETANNTLNAGGQPWRMYQNLSQTVKIKPNQWFLVKQHLKVSAPQGAWEAWIRPQGGAFTKVASFIGGVTPGFTWPIASQPFASGFHRFKFPTTENGNATRGDNWKYLADLAIATSEANLPTYG